jgi:hypothetical protein
MAGCGLSHPVGCVTSVVGGAISDEISNFEQYVVKAVAGAAQSLGTVWLSVPTPQIASGSGPSPTVGFLQDSLRWYVWIFAAVSLALAGARLAWQQRAEPAREAIRSLLTLTIVSGCGVAAIDLLTQASDSFAQWIVDRSTQGTSFADNVSGLLGITASTSAATASPLPVLLIIVMGLIALFVSLIQIALMVVRGGMLVVLAGILPLTASGTGTETGRLWFRRSISWLIAFLLYKPAAAIFYAAAFRMAGTHVGSDGSGLTTVITGVTLMLLALVALPGLMRFVAPMTAAVASGGGSGAMFGAAAMALPSGAMSIPAPRGGTGSLGSGSSSSGPNGSVTTGGRGGTSGSGGGGASPPGGSGGGSGAGPGGGGPQGSRGSGAETSGGAPATGPSGGASTAAAGGGAASSAAGAAGPGAAVLRGAAAAHQAGKAAGNSAVNGQSGGTEGPSGSS